MLNCGFEILLTLWLFTTQAQTRKKKQSLTKIVSDFTTRHQDRQTSNLELYQKIVFAPEIPPQHCDGN